MTKLELLAPAKDLEHGKAAIIHGADAVYIGAPKFSARKAAGTSLQQIEELARFAHLYFAKVYVALNTILFDSELEEAACLIKNIYEAGADALIIQDMGILEMDIPPIPLFASTQTHNETPGKVLFLEKAGFKRVILARELSLDQITHIREQTSVELESFVHGALCVSYSGQCYMSHSVCGRSGNRGDCAQPCRSSYNLTDANGNIIARNKHLLSLKDMNLTDQIPDLIKAGITSFKIEGRLKDMTYLKNVVSWYRNCIDNYVKGSPNYCKASSGKCSFSFLPDPQKSYNRGYTNYNIHGRNDKLATYHTQKATGTKVGVITHIKEKQITYNGKKLHPGDGLCFFSKSHELKGFYVNRIDGDKIEPSNYESLYEGALLYRNFDKKFEDEINQSAERRIYVSLRLERDENFLKLTITDEDGIQVINTKQITTAEAENQEKALNTLKTQLIKTGNSAFNVTRMEINLKTIPFVPVSQINELRREAIKMLACERLSRCTREEQKTEPNNYPYPVSNLDYHANISNRLSEKFYKRHGVQSFETAFELREIPNQALLMTTKHCIRYQMDACPAIDHHKNKLSIPLYLTDQKHKYHLKFDCKECKMLVYRISKSK